MHSDLQFEASTHTYTLAGQVLPSVTTVLEYVLREMEDIPRANLEAAAAFGTNVHLAAHLHDRRELDRQALAEPLRPYLDGYEAFLHESRAVVLASSKRVYHPAHRYAGELDKSVVFPAVGQRWKREPAVLDIKSSATVPRSVGAQTAAYREAEVARGVRMSQERYSLHLRPDGTYRLGKLTRSTDFSLFISCLNVWRYRNA